MSVINQVLLDLEKRRASPAERGAVPNHVRALPDGGGSSSWVWIAGAATAALATAAAAAWMVLGGTVPASPPVQRSGTEAAIEQVVTASAGVTLIPQRPNAPAFQLSFELSNPPTGEASPRESAASLVPLQSARVVSRPAAASEAESSASPKKEKSPVIAAVKPDAPGAAGLQPEIKKQVRQPAAREQAENEFRRATALLHQGRLAESQEGFEAAINLYPAYHGARQALVGLLVEGRRLADAERVLQEGLALAPSQIGFAMTLARLQVDRGDAALAAATLRKGLEHAQGSPDYIAFLAALLQRQGRHDEAIEQFQSALRLRPTTGVWWLGLGISLQAVNRTADAQEAYRRARTTNSLSPELAAFAEQRIKQLQ